MTREMKDSGIEWIGEVPVGWELKKNKLFFEEINIKSVNGDEELLSVSEYFGVRPRRKIVKKGAIISRSENLVGYKVCESNDLIINIMLAWKRSLGITRYSGIVSPAYAVFRLNSKNEVPRYFDYLFRTDLYANYFKAFSTGIIDSRLRLYPDKFLSLYSHFPPRNKREEIVRYLDAKVDKIEQIITESQQSITELKKYKQSLITEAVTKGLDPNVERKDSGIEWIGEIPEDWGFVKLGNISTKIGSGKTPRGGEDVYSKSGILFLRSQNIYDEGLELEKPRFITREIHDEMNNTKVQCDDVLLNITGGSIGRSSIYNLKEEANVNQHVCIIRPKKEILCSKWIHYCLISHIGDRYVNYFQTGGNREGLNFGEIRKFRIPLPEMKIQLSISSHLDTQTSRIDQLIEDKTKVIAELESYKKSLIYEYVTGKREIK